MKIFLNPGHDRDLDPGAVNPVNGLREADVVYSVSAGITNSIKEILEEHGVEVILMQNDSLEDVVDEANSSGCDYFVSIHCNAFNTVARGTEVEAYSLSSEGADLAQSIQDEIVYALDTIDRGVKERPGLYVLKYTDIPSCLVELAFIDNNDDCELLMTRQEDFARAVAKGILNHIGEDFDDAIPHVELSPKGIPYDDNDVQYLLNQGYTRAEALSFLDTTDKYSNANMQKAAEYADSRVGTRGYGNNGCTAWVEDFLLHANSWFGELMENGSQGNLMWVPNIMDYAKEHGIWKEPAEGGSLGDICVIETNYCRSDGPDHVVIATGDGDYWGNSSSRNLIVKSSIADDFGSENIWGYVATGSGEGSVVEGESNRTASEIIGDAGSTSYTNLAPNGRAYEENDIKYLENQGYDMEAVIDILSKAPKYTQPIYRAPNGKIIEQNDIDYLTNNGYTVEAAVSFLKSADKYLKK